MSTTHSFNVVLTQVVCPNCGGVYAISQAFEDEAYRLGGFRKMWACPYCHQKRGYGESENDRLKKQVESAVVSRDLALRRERNALAEAAHFRKSRDGMKGQLVKTKKAIANGVCPCCHRYFKDLHRHMIGQHPDYESQT